MDKGAGEGRGAGKQGGKGKQLSNDAAEQKQAETSSMERPAAETSAIAKRVDPEVNKDFKRNREGENKPSGSCGERRKGGTTGSMRRQLKVCEPESIQTLRGHFYTHVYTHIY